MALVTCRDCGKQVSEQAPACPNCGRPMNTQPSKVEDVNAGGFMGKPGTMSHALNVGCATFLIGIVVVVILLAIKFGLEK